MPLTIKFTVGQDTFEAEGDFTFDDGLLSVVQAWARAIGPAPEQSDLDALAARAESQNQQLADAVAAHQPPSGE
jgi:hypothetical protein